MFTAPSPTSAGAEPSPVASPGTPIREVREPITVEVTGGERPAELVGVSAIGTPSAGHADDPRAVLAPVLVAGRRQSDPRPVQDIDRAGVGLRADVLEGHADGEVDVPITVEVGGMGSHGRRRGERRLQHRQEADQRPAITLRDRPPCASMTSDGVRHQPQRRRGDPITPARVESAVAPDLSPGPNRAATARAASAPCDR